MHPTRISMDAIHMIREEIGHGPRSGSGCRGRLGFVIAYWNVLQSGKILSTVLG
jgi:hypothetical protein